MKLFSSAFNEGEFIPKRYTCDGLDISPPLSIKEVPEGAKSLALVMDDPDAPNGTWLHWTIWNLDPAAGEINERSAPGMQGMNDFRKTAYGGPCPPDGVHRYYFKLYALDTVLPLQSGATRDRLEAAMKGHVLGQAVLMGRYSRQER